MTTLVVRTNFQKQKRHDISLVVAAEKKRDGAQSDTSKHSSFRLCHNGSIKGFLSVSTDVTPRHMLSLQGDRVALSCGEMSQRETSTHVSEASRHQSDHVTHSGVDPEGREFKVERTKLSKTSKKCRFV